MDFIEGLKQLEEKRESQKLKSFWVGHSVFQLPFRVLSYKGKSEALTLAYFYERANSVSFYSRSETVIEIPVKQKTIAARTGLDEDTVSDAITSLEADDCIRVSRRRDERTKTIRLSVYLLLHSRTGEPLTSSPGVFGVCHQNHEKPYITVPKEARAKLVQLNPSGRQVYLAALALGSLKTSTTFEVGRADWQRKSLLGRNAFDRAVDECEKAGLLSYSRYVLTLNDPRTGQPSQRTPAERIEHDNPTWAFDLDAITADQWRIIIGRLLPGREFDEGEDGWTYTSRGGQCPFCKAQRSFSVNFITCQYRCYSDTCGDISTGKLGQLVQRVRRTSMAEAKNFIRECLETETVAA